jgi:uncharacterized RDD family membrane protein YckC
VQGQLYCLSGVHAGEIFPLGITPVVIGCDPGVSHIILPTGDQQYSGKHAAIWFDPQQNVCFLQDFSTNGVFKASGERLSPGQIVAIGPGERFFLVDLNCMFEFRLAAQELGAAAVGSYGNFPNYAGFWRRLGACIIDGLLLTIILTPLTLLAENNMPQIWLGDVVVNWLYFALMESSVQQGTLGKMAIGLKVTDLAGNRIGFGRASGRFFGKYLSTMILCIGYLFIVFTDRKQALHDLMASCLVLKKS